MKSRVFVTIAFLLAAMAVPIVAAAQTQKFELATGYEFLRDQEIEENFLLGWTVSGTYNISDTLGIVGDIGGSYKSVDALGLDANLSVHGFLFGPKFTSRTNKGWTPFFHVLAGWARASGSVAGIGLGSSTEFAVQPGGGVDINIHETMAFRVGGDFRRILSDPGANEFRLVAGLVFKFGEEVTSR